MTGRYTTLAGPAAFSQVVKNSEFLGFAAPIQTVESAFEFVAALRAERSDASHVCWAYKLGTQYRLSDDGEPGGTAGAPIYRALEQSGLEGVVVAVVRYYGGVNLGAGGLARAYGGTTAELLRIAPRLEVHPRVAVAISVSFELMNPLYRLLEGCDVQDRQEEFTDSGLVTRFAILESELERLKVAVRDATRGQAKIW